MLKIAAFSILAKKISGYLMYNIIFHHMLIHVNMLKYFCKIVYPKIQDNMSIRKVSEFRNNMIVIG